MAGSRNNSESASNPDSPDATYFNDLNQQPQSKDRTNDTRVGEAGEQASKAKRIACILCRKRKLRCDGAKPACATCQRLAHDCSYDEVRRKSGPKRGYVKALEARLAQVETLLKTTKESSPDGSGPGQDAIDIDGVRSDRGMNVEGANDPFSNSSMPPAPATFPNLQGGDALPWELIQLGLNEPLPSEEVINELNQIYFDKVHPTIPMIHRPRFLAAMNLAPQARPPICLRYAMWATAASISDKFESLQDAFYQRARTYAQQDEMKSFGEGMITVAHAQAWYIIGMYEFKMTMFPRAWMSTGRGVRLCLMMGLHRLDGAALDVKQCISPPRDWTEREERRRTFWMCFAEDRYASIGTGWPFQIDERDIMTHLPVDNEAYEQSKPMPSMSLTQALDPEGARNLSPLGGVVLLACLFGRNLTHLHRPQAEDNDHDLNGEFWKRHTSMDGILLNTSLALPDQLRLPLGVNNASTVFLNLCLHTSTICLHQAAIYKAEKNQLPSKVSAESKIRCITAAGEIASIMRMISHQDLSVINPFSTFCLYVAARVFVQYLKSRPNDHLVKASLQFLLSAMHAMRKKNPLTESFIVQLEVDLEGAGMRDARLSRAAQMATASHPAMGAAKRGPCPMSHMNEPATFGNNGLAAHTSPNQPSPDGSGQRSFPSGYAYGMPAAEENPPFNFQTPGGHTFDIPSRGKTPATVPEPTPSILPDEMDMSADVQNDSPLSTSNSNPNSNSQHNTSSQTSVNGFTPPSYTLQPEEYQAAQNSAYNPFPTKPIDASTAFFDLASGGTGINNAFNDFDFPSFTTSGQFDTTAGDPSFSLPPDWGIGGGGIPTPAAGMGPGPGPGPGPGSGFAPGATGDMMGMTDADWAQMLEIYGSWEPPSTRPGIL